MLYTFEAMIGTYNVQHTTKIKSTTIKNTISQHIIRQVVKPQQEKFYHRSNILLPVHNSSCYIYQSLSICYIHLLSHDPYILKKYKQELTAESDKSKIVNLQLSEKNYLLNNLLQYISKYNIFPFKHIQQFWKSSSFVLSFYSLNFQFTKHFSTPYDFSFSRSVISLCSFHFHLGKFEECSTKFTVKSI